MKKKINNFFTLKRSANGGFTLVELVVVIAILAILAGAAVPAYSGYINKANEAADQQLLAAMNTAYASACAAEGESHIGRKDVSGIKLEGGLIPSSYAMTSNEGIDEAFGMFFQDGQFKRFQILTFDSALGVFSGSNTIGEALQKIWGGTSYGAGADKGKAVAQMLLGTMDTIDGYLAGGQPFSALFEGTPDALLNALGFADMSEGFDDVGVMHFAEDAKDRTAQEVLDGATGLLNLLELKDDESLLSGYKEQDIENALIATYFSTLEDGNDTVLGDTTWENMDRDQKLQAAKANLKMDYGDLHLTAEEVLVLTYAAGTGTEGLGNSAGVSGVGGMYALAAGYYNSVYGKDSSTKPTGDNAASAYGQFGTVLKAMEEDGWEDYLANQALQDMEAYVSFMGYLSEGEFGEGDTFAKEGYEWIAGALGIK